LAAFNRGEYADDLSDCFTEELDSQEELDRLCSPASGPNGILIYFIGRNGLRSSEAPSMRWSNIDLGARTMTINCQLNDKDEFTDAKTRKAYRTIALDEITADKPGGGRRNRRLPRSTPVWSGKPGLGGHDGHRPPDSAQQPRSLNPPALQASRH
jgi:integrase